MSQGEPVFNFFDELQNAIHAQAAGAKQFTLEAFTTELVNRLEVAEVLLDVSVHPVVDVTGRNRRRLELLGYGHEQADDSLVVVVGAHSGQPDAVLTRSDASRIFDAGVHFIEQAADGWLEENLEISSPAVELAMYFRRLLESTAESMRVDRLRFVLVTDATMSDRLRTIDTREVAGRRATFEIWDLARLEALAASASGLEDLEIDLTRWLPDGLPCLPAAETDEEAHSYLAVLPGAVLAAVFREHGSRLLESNVRTYLSARGKVNKGIQSTLLNEPSMFLAYNNGLTTTATGVVLKQGATGPAITSIQNWQIVNGGQTTSSLVHFLRAGGGRSLDGVYVQMKLVTVAADKAAELVANVSRYANSQNKVNEADFFSNSKFHVELEKISTRVKAPAREGQQYQTAWFYERTRGQYEARRNALPPSQQKKFDLEFPKTQKVTKTDWAKFAFSWGKKPHIVSKGAQANFMAYAEEANRLWDASPELINDAYFKAGMAKAIMFRDVRSGVLAADWYGRGYLANIVTYAMAKVAFEVDRQGPGKFDFEDTWRRQELSSAARDQLLAGARLAQDVLNDPKRSQQNVTQWAKQEACWKLMQSRPLGLSPEFLDELMDESSHRSLQTAARADARIDAEFQVVARVMKVKPDVWRRVIEHGVRRGFVGPVERDIVQKFAGGRAVPSDRQARKMLEVLERAADHTVIYRNDF